MGRLVEHDLRTQSDDGCFFLEPMLPMVISNCQDRGSVTGAQVREQWTAES